MAFHPYPQVIPSVFNRSGFGPPQSLTSASACPWIDHPASRLRLATDRHLKGSLSLRLGSRLNLAANRNSLAHSTKGTPSQRMAAPTACRHTVSGTVSLPSRGAFHLSLTVLVRYRSRESVQPWRVVPPASRGVSRAPRYSGPETRCQRPSGYGALTLFRRPSQAVPLRGRFMTAGGGCGPLASRPATPARKRPHAVTRAPVWAGPVSLAATPGISVDFSSSGYLDVSVPPVASWRPIYSGAGSGTLPPLGSPIRESRDRRPFAPPPGLSQLAAPFVDFPRQGIRLAPFVSSS